MERNGATSSEMYAPKKPLSICQKYSHYNGSNSISHTTAQQIQPNGLLYQEREMTCEM